MTAFMDVDAYLKRIGLARPIEPNLANLERLQRAHLTAVPFENLHVFYRREVRTNESWSVPKIVEGRRGGWCFELNGAFAWLLGALGYPVRRLAAIVIGGSSSPMPTHLTLEVMLDRPYLVDVGFGDSFIKPLPLDSQGPHDGGSGTYGFIFGEDSTTLVSQDGTTLTPHYRFGPDEHLVDDFEEASTHLRTAPGLRWTEGRFATRLLDGGPDRVTLLEDLVKFRRDGVWTEQSVSPADWPALLEKWFGMTP
jgi:N-hydroxyarylamine O-acetyltransferase